MKKLLIALMSISILLMSFLSFGDDNKTRVTTQTAAEAKKREGQTGTSNENAASQLKKIEAEEKSVYKAAASSASSNK